ncbi:MAG TPA: PQQ-dependent sugar dehydrogenase [Chloroflexaceae bacterium]|nr:PQQ-dependent sugar dehydrogenase [Chloroflexaceae bacterium]
MRIRPVSLLLAAALLAGCAAARGEAPEPTVLPAEPTASAVEPTAAAEAPPAEATAAPAAPSEATPAQAEPTAPAATAAPAASLDQLAVGAELLVDGLVRPTHVTSAGDGSGRLFVTEQAGLILVVRDGQLVEEPFLDLLALVGANGNEQGLLSVAFHPDYAANGRFYVNYTDRDGTTVVARYSVSADNPDRADAASAQVLLTIEQPAPNHNGGLLKFGPDGYLYIGTGDGGAAGDPWGNAQSLDTLLGKLLRIDVDGGEPYAVPEDNPFGGFAGERPEIWAYGLRNPWRFSFDRATGDLYIGDVGQNEYEEVNFVSAASMGGENYGWDIMEGRECYDARSCEQAGLTMPVATYSHSAGDGCSITGGYVYRGAAFPQLEGVYLYADYCSGNLWGLRAPFVEGGGALLATLDLRVTSFGEDEVGELYLADREGGGIYRLVAES